MYIKNKPSQKKIRSVNLFLLASLLLPVVSNAQCAMCRAALQGEGNQSQAEAVNDGIIYLMIIPYVLVAAIGYYVYQSRKNRAK